MSPPKSSSFYGPSAAGNAPGEYPTRGDSSPSERSPRRAAPSAAQDRRARVQRIRSEPEAGTSADRPPSRALRRPNGKPAPQAPPRGTAPKRRTALTEKAPRVADTSECPDSSAPAPLSRPLPGVCPAPRAPRPAHSGATDGNRATGPPGNGRRGPVFHIDPQSPRPGGVSDRSTGQGRPPALRCGASPGRGRPAWKRNPTDRRIRAGPRRGIPEALEPRSRRARSGGSVPCREPEGFRDGKGPEASRFGEGSR